MNELTECVTILKEEYDDLNKAANALMLIFNTPPVFLDQAVAAAKKAINGPDYADTEPSKPVSVPDFIQSGEGILLCDETRAEISE